MLAKHKYLMLGRTVSFHGGLSSTDASRCLKYQRKGAILHGADDPHVPSEEVNEFKNL